MTSLHAYFHLRNQQAFQRLLSDSSGTKSQSSSANISSGALSTSGGKSWTKPSALPGAITASAVNERDWLGRTVLHLASASTEPYALEFVRMLLAHPAINVNIPDKESNWTALHRALYSGNIPAALLLLQRADIDTSIKDNEGYTAFDLYNSTVQGTKPADDISANRIYELFTWGANRNASLGLGDGDDRMHPEQVVIPRQECRGSDSVSDRFSPVMVKDIAMAKLHTAVVTSEPKANLWLCGFGSGGRLGPGTSTQYSLKTLATLNHYTIITMALGQDHTLAVTQTGEVFSWGLNRFGQLGYVIENVQPGSEPIQPVPKRILGPLKKDMTVRGVAASRMASACWTDTEVYTWGTNTGQLGYEKGQGLQILPRLVAKVSQPVTSVVLTNTAMACLLLSKEVLLFWNGRHFKINFPQAFPSDISIYRPPQFVKDANVAKIVSCNETFAAVSSNGEVFTFTVPNPSDADAGKERTVVKPQRVWALRKQFSAVRDAALGTDGSLIICTESGHVFVRERSAKQTSSSAKSFKFQRIPNLQRIVGVRANATGSFGALRQEYTPKPIFIAGNTLSQDMGQNQPWLVSVPKHIIHKDRALVHDLEEDEEKEDMFIRHDIEELIAMCQTLDHPSDKELLASAKRLPLGADLIVQADKFVFPVHSLILAVRSPIIGQCMQGKEIHHSTIKVQYRQKTPKTHSSLTISGVKPLTVLLFLNYLYTDNIVAVWDNRVSRWTEKFHIDPWQTRSDLQTLSRVFGISALLDALDSHTKRMAQPTLARDFGALLASSTKADVALQLGDHKFLCHSVILRTRSAFFGDMFSDDTWTKTRWNEDGVITVQMQHLKRRSMDFVLRFIYCDVGQETFERIDFVNTLDEFLEFMFEVLAAANELLLTRLVDICSSILLQYVNVYNACYLLADATHYHAEQLILRLQSYISINLELFLDAHMLNDLPPYLIKQLAVFIRRAQEDKSPTTRSSILLYLAMEQNKEWIEEQDIPQPIITKPFKPKSPKTPTKVPRSFAAKKETLPRSASPIDSSLGDDVFAMDEADLSVPSTPKAAPPSRPSGWKEISTAPKADMKAIMAETARSSSILQPSTPVKEGQPIAYRPPQKISETPPPAASRTPGSPWKVRATPSRPQIVPFPALSAPQGTPSSSKATPSRAAAPAQQPGLGPTIQPARQQQLSSSPQSTRRVSGGAAWSTPPIQPAPPTRTPSGGVSLVAIQQSQLAEGISPSVPKRSLREIQEEEQARQAEVDFLKWWEEEEERVRLETEAAITISAAHSDTPKGGQKSPRKKRPEPRDSAAAEGSNRGGSARRGGRGGRGRGQNWKGPAPSDP